MPDLVALDTNPFLIMLQDRPTMEFMGYLQEAMERSEEPLRLACDEGKIVREAYEGAVPKLAPLVPPGCDHMLLTGLLSAWGSVTVPRPASLCPEAQTFLKDQGCDTGLEQTLLALATNKNVVLVAAPPHVKHALLDKRIIVCDPEKVAELRRQIQRATGGFPPDLRVVHCDKAKVHLENKRYSELFEDKIGDWVRNRGEWRYPTVEIRKRLSFGGESAQADVYGRDDSCEPWRRLVCECKLRMPDNTDEPIMLDEVEQAIETRRVVSGLSHESARGEGHTVRVYAVLVSNAEGVAQEAWNLADREDITLLKADLSRNWHCFTEWIVERCTRYRRPKSVQASNGRARHP